MGPQSREFEPISTIPISHPPPPLHHLHHTTAAMFPIRGRLSDPITTFREKSGSLSSIKSGKFSSSSKKDLVRETAQTAYQSIKERALMQGSGSVSGSPGRIQENLSRDSGIGGLKEGLNTSGESEHEIPKYISDVTDMSNYVRGRFLGKGGFARVHELIDLQTNSLFAGKIINKSRISKPHHKEKITREIELHRNLIHKNVVQFIKNFEDSDNIYIVLENCSKRSLVHVLKARHVVTEIETRYYMQQLVNGVQYIHSQNIIHRDLKLGNLFLTGTMAVKIGDFGLATRVGWEKKGTICGTPNYISPEVLNKDGHGFPADVWALGCVMYALLVGQPPFETSTLKETYTRIAENVYSIPEAVSPLAASLIRQLLHPDPKQRPLVPNIAQDPFFTCGYCPVSLPPSACSVTPLLAPPVYKTDSSPIPGGYPHHHNGLVSRLSASTTNLDSKRLQSPKISSKDSMFPGMCESVANTVFSKLYKPDIQTLSSRNNSPKARTRTEELHLAVKTALSSMPSSRLTDPPAATLKDPPTFIAKWIDYSNKYGFGFQLSDKSIGILFNDNTRISYSSDRSFIQFGENQEVTTMGTHQVPPYLHEKFTLLRYFAQYMDQNLTEGGETRKGLRSLTTTIPQIKRWIRTPKAIIMHLTNGTIQVNYFKDHTKLIIGSLDEAVTSSPQQQQNCPPSQASHQPFIVTYINSARESRCFHLNDLARHGASQPIRERMSYVAEVLNEFVELDKQIS